MENETQVPNITFFIDPPSDNKDYGPPSADPIHWTPEHYNGHPSSFPGYPQASMPQAIPRLNTSYDELNNVRGNWEARSPCSSDSGWSNPSSPRVDQFSEEFRDDGSDYLSDYRSHVSDQDGFDMDAFLNLTTSDVQSPDNTSFSADFLSGPDLFTTSPVLRDTNTSAMQSIPYTSPYAVNRVSSSASLEHANGYPGLSTSLKDFLPVKPTHHRSSSDFLAPPPTMTRSARSHSRGPRGHRFTISEGSDPFANPHTSPESSMFLGEDFRGRGLARAKTAPSTKSISRGKSPYDRPGSQTGMDNLVIPKFAGPISGQSTPELECPSPGSGKDIVATEAMIQASVRRRRREANYFCSQCGNSFTTENSRKRHENSHNGEKPYLCSFPDCGQMFSNDDDRKRHENKSKKHAR